ncbi:MAG: A/G-specific adenine glycosylase [Planctomycetia bacterium]
MATGNVKVEGRRARPPAAGRVSPPLVAWYARARRDLPWRRSRDPYRVWVSEIMLQQTQVERVKVYFTRFIAAFPTVRMLAAADEDDVLRLWEGLGYYRRARQLHAAAKQIVAEHRGRFPRSLEGLRGLPGIGRYTAGAILSIAFDEPAPIVEATSRRVIARLFGHAARLDGPGGDAPIWEIAERLVPDEGPGTFNQALMDLGALVCTPDRPLCTQCPLVRLCVAHHTGRTAAIPARAARRQTTDIREIAVVLRQGDRVLVERRGEGEWWAGLWDFPRAASPKSLAAFGPGKRRKLGRITHTVTHHKISLEIVEIAVPRTTRKVANRAWVPVGKLATLAMSAPGRRIAVMIGRQ